MATGTRPAIPAVPGLSEAGFLTNESVFTLTRRPESLAVIGGGPSRLRAGPGFRPLGLERHPHPKSRPASTQGGPGRLRAPRPGLPRRRHRFHVNAGLTKVEVRDGKKILHWTVDGRPDAAEVFEILVGAGRVPNVEGLGLEKAGVSV